ncbi:hypothetical protein MKX47_08050 [Solibacillus sp. FSL R7-0668]
MKKDILQSDQPYELELFMEENVFEDIETCFIQFVTASFVIELD